MGRYERKFRIEEATAEEVRAVLTVNPAAFRVAFPDRRVNSIYLDDSSFGALQENLSGIAQRSKYRVRWYGENVKEAKEPTLEIKLKNNFTNTKKFHQLPSFTLKKNFNLIGFLNTHLPLPNKLFPVSLVSYQRSYFLSMDGKIRATIDQKQRYYLFQGQLWMSQSPYYDNAIILEMKYEARHDDDFDYIFQKIPFRLTKNSKYVNSIFSNYY